MPPTDPPLGALVEVPAGRGIVRFAGATSFSAGKWIGIELYEPNGKNDGSVQGVKYFNCRPNYGVFVRPSQVKLISAEPEPAPAPPVSLWLTPASRLKSTNTSLPSLVQSVTSAQGVFLVLRPFVPYPLHLAPAAPQSHLLLLMVTATPSSPLPALHVSVHQQSACLHSLCNLAPLSAERPQHRIYLTARLLLAVAPALENLQH